LSDVPVSEGEAPVYAEVRDPTPYGMDAM